MTPDIHDPSATKKTASRHRRVVYISEVDQRLLERGLEPSWEQKISSEDIELSGGAKAASNDSRLKEDIPPHSHARS